MHRKFCRSLCFHLWVVNSVGSNSHFFGRCKSYYLKGWLKWCHEPVWPAVSERPARKALRQLTVLVVGLCCLFSLRLISHGWPEICWRVGKQTQNKQKTTLQLGANVWKSSSPSYLEKQMLSRGILVNTASTVCNLYALVSLLYGAVRCTREADGTYSHSPFFFLLFFLKIISSSDF